MKKTLSICILWLLIGSCFAHKELIIENRDNKPIRVIKTVLDGEHYIVSSVAEEGWATLKDLTKKVGGNTAVNGVFFCPEDYTQCNTTHTISERVFLGNGKDRSTYRPDTSIRMIFGFDQTGKPLLVQNNLGNMIDQWLRIKKDPLAFTTLYFGLGNFPIFLYKGSNVVDGYTFFIDKKMKTPGKKTFICSTEDKSTIYMGVIGNITIPDMPKYLKKNFDCRDAMNLDAGNSIGMIYSGFVLDQWPRKKIMDAYVVLTKEEYIKLTNSTPTFKTQFSSTSQDQLTQDDNAIATKIYTTLQNIIVQEGEQTKQKFIQKLREMITTYPYKISTEKNIIKEVLRKLHIIDIL